MRGKGKGEGWYIEVPRLEGCGVSLGWVKRVWEEGCRWGRR